MTTKQSIINAINTLRQRNNTNRQVLNQLEQRANTDPRMTRDEGTTDHFCSFLLPVNKDTKSIYLGDHKKAGSWIPPGGHIDKDETITQAVMREMQEELGEKITEFQIELFDVSVIEVNHPGRCTVHNDFWNLIYTEKKDFPYDKKEFKDAKWFYIDDALKQMTNEVYLPVMQKVRAYLLNENAG